MNRELESIDQSLKIKIIKISFKLEDSVLLKNTKQNLILPCSKKNLLNYQTAIQLKAFSIISHNDLENEKLFIDWYTKIGEYNKTEFLLNDNNIKFFQEIKVTFDESYQVFRCHINSKKYFGNGHDKIKWIAIINAMYDALY